MRMGIIAVYTGRYDYTDSNKMWEFYIHFVWFKNDVVPTKNCERPCK